MRFLWIMNKKLIYVLLLFIIFAYPACAKKESEYYKVTEIHDGDTLTIVKDSFFGILVKTERIRLIGIDAPELAQEPWGRKAKNHLKKLIRESSWLVKIELDVQQRDKYGRILAYLWDKNGNMINYMMIRDGYAMVYTIPPNVKYAEKFVEAQRVAREEKRGIWGENGLKEKPSDWRKANPRS
ncbi:MULTISPECIES: thermonuclease family protein [Thermodesulfovibrio]|uniref:thermonuclease family protein n=1 Tax=Thermodesulfovibrio TaxID=28261 RepID=UPI002605AB15|nr:thermonuclease family protein [Thermodesulfovibrio sp.]